MRYIRTAGGESDLQWLSSGRIARIFSIAEDPVLQMPALGVQIGGKAWGVLCESSDSHSQYAEACLRYLASGEFNHGRVRGRASLQRPVRSAPYRAGQ
jgi:hypothetical protein